MEVYIHRFSPTFRTNKVKGKRRWLGCRQKIAVLMDIKPSLKLPSDEHIKTLESLWQEEAEEGRPYPVADLGIPRGDTT